MNFVERMNDLADAGALQTRKLYAKAKGNVRTVGTRAGLSLQIAQREREARGAFERLGVLTYEKLMKAMYPSLSSTDSRMKELLDEISLREVQIEKLWSRLNRLSRKGT